MRPTDIKFHWNAVASAELGVALGKGEQPENHFQVPASGDVNKHLKEMLVTTRGSLEKLHPEGPFPSLELPELYPPQTALFLKADTDFVADAMTLLDLANLPTAPNALDDPEAIRLYFGLFMDAKGNKIAGFKRPVTFKGLAKRKLFKWNPSPKGKELVLAPEAIFALDHDFDYIVTKEGIFILHPANFNSAAVNNDEICRQSAAALPAMQTRSKFIAFSKLEAFVKDHPMAAKLLASIRQRQDLDKMSKDLFRDLLTRQDVVFEEYQGMIAPASKYELDFLRVLDRRLYDLELVEGVTEQYAASGRTQRKTKSKPATPTKSSKARRR